MRSGRDFESHVQKQVGVTFQVIKKVWFKRQAVKHKFSKLSNCGQPMRVLNLERK